MKSMILRSSTWLIAIAILIFASTIANAAKPQMVEKRYRYTFNGDITGWVITGNISHGAKPRYQVGTTHNSTTDGVFFANTSGSFSGYKFKSNPAIYGSDCFLFASAGKEQIRPGLHVNWDRGQDWVTMTRWFDGTAGGKDMLYMLEMHNLGFFTDGAPTELTLVSGCSESGGGVCDSTTVTFGTGELWEMGSEGHGKLKNVSCTGDGIIAATVAGVSSLFPNGVTIKIERVPLLP